jgi:hypothetical protein
LGGVEEHYNLRKASSLVADKRT